jgi:hypothetical protein
MFYSHRFARPETRSRATYWLKEFGIDAAQMWVDHRTQQLSFHAKLGQFVEFRSIIQALEAAEASGRMTNWDVIRHLDAHRDRPVLEPYPSSRRGPAHFPVGWRPDDR